MYASKMLQLGETEARLYAYFTTAECDHATRSKLIADGNENLLRVRCQNKTHKAASVVRACVCIDFTAERVASRATQIIYSTDGTARRESS